MPRRSDCRRLIDPADPRVWTAHEHIDITRVTSGRQILLSGHRFWVADMAFTTTGRPTGDPRPGHDFAAGIGQVDLKLTHTQWKGCPAVDPVDRHMPKDWRAGLAELRDAALRILAHPSTTPGDGEFLRERLAPLVDLGVTEVPGG